MFPPIGSNVRRPRAAYRALQPFARRRNTDLGQGVPQDFAEAAKWYRKAADQGNAHAQNILGHMYTSGRGVRKDLAEAVKWYRLAADQGDEEAQHLLGFLYSLSAGVPVDEAEAAKWYRKAADQGDAGAQAFLGYTYEEGMGVPKDYVLAYMWLNLAAAQGNKDERDDLAQHMTPEQIAEAQKLAREWKPTTQPTK